MMRKKNAKKSPKSQKRGLQKGGPAECAGRWGGPEEGTKILARALGKRQELGKRLKSLKVRTGRMSPARRAPC